jgi:NAD(P)-dependent dehydrogenase (short-subunit alcohol dehydrogenase family)
MNANFDVKGKVIALTGGSSGIGFAAAQLLVSQGAKVSIADIREEALQEAESKLKAASGPGEYMTTVVDVRKPEQVNQWIQKTVEKFGKLDGGVNMAGVIPKNISIDRVEEMPDDEW